MCDLHAAHIRRHLGFLSFEFGSFLDLPMRMHMREIGCFGSLMSFFLSFFSFLCWFGLGRAFLGGFDAYVGVCVSVGQVGPGM